MSKWHESNKSSQVTFSKCARFRCRWKIPTGSLLPTILQNTQTYVYIYSYLGTEALEIAHLQLTRKPVIALHDKKKCGKKIICYHITKDKYN